MALEAVDTFVIILDLVYRELIAREHWKDSMQM